MIHPDEIRALITATMNDAEIEIIDKTGASDHFIIKVVSKHFQDVSIMDRHRNVMALLQPAMATGALHAVELKTELPN